MENLSFQEEYTRIKFKPLDPPTVRKLAVDPNSLRQVNNLDELRSNTPNFVVAECVKDITFVQNYFKPQTLHKKQKYVLPLGMYQILHHDVKRDIRILKPSGIKFQNIYRPYQGQDLTNKTLFVTRTGGIGDLLFIQPDLIYLKEKYPSCKIKFFCGPQYHQMIQEWDCIDDFSNLPFTLNNFLDSDYHVIFEGVIERCKSAETTNAYHLFTEWMGLNLSNDKLIPKQNPNIKKVEECQELLKQFNLEENDFVLIQMRASSPIRTPSFDFTRKVINKLTENGYKVVITDSPKAGEKWEIFRKSLERQEMVTNFAIFSKSIDWTIAMTSLCGCVLSIDSSLTHIGASLGKPVVGIFGAFPGEIRMKTYKNCDWIDAKSECSPCYLHGNKPCPKSKGFSAPCFDSIDIEQIMSKIQKVWR